MHTMHTQAILINISIPFNIVFAKSVSIIHIFEYYSYILKKMLYRSTKYGSPFFNLNAGVDSRDSENWSNMKKIKESFKNS